MRPKIGIASITQKVNVAGLLTINEVSRMASFAALQGLFTAHATRNFATLGATLRHWIFSFCHN